MKAIFIALIAIFPWPMKRWCLQTFFGHKIDPKARIGMAYIAPGLLEMAPHSYIGHFTIIKNLEKVSMGQHAYIGRGNWITGFPIHSKTHFQHVLDRNPMLEMGDHSSMTNGHIIDCTAKVSIGEFATFAGFRSQILSHSIDIAESRQDCSPITIGAYSFVGTNCTLLPGSGIPAYSVLGAKALLNKNYHQTYHLYGGNPAKPIKELPKESKYFNRQEGFC